MTRSSEEQVGVEVKQEERQRDAAAGPQSVSHSQSCADQQQHRQASGAQLLRLVDRLAAEASPLPVAQDTQTAPANNNNQANNSDQQQQQAQDRAKRNPFCSRCRNHGKFAKVKGHKRHCDYRDCQCEGCKLVECRQIVSARQIKLRRYQKQDEEYGRRIEVSPPVLKRDPNNDSMSLFANTLMGATSPPLAVQHFKRHNATSLHTTTTTSATKSNNIELATDCVTSGPASKRQRRSVAELLAAGYPSSGLQSAALQDGGTTNNSAGGITSTAPAQLHPQPQPHQLPLPTQATTAAHWANQRLMAAAAAAASVTSDPNCGEPTLNPALAIPFHLFNLPHGPMLSRAQAAAAALCKSTSSMAKLVSEGSSPGAATTCTTTGAPLSGSSASATRLFPSIHEQINLVEDIHRTYGPLAIYAWLKYEHFDLQKIRDLIEISTCTFDELLQLTGHSPLDLTSPIVD